MPAGAKNQCNTTQNLTQHMNYYFITGPSRGIGKALAELILKEKDNHIIGISRHSTINHDRYTHIPLDLSDTVAVDNNLYKVFLPFPEAKRLVLINNAAVLGDIGYVGEGTNEHFNFVLDVNLVSAAMLMNSFLKTYAGQVARKTVMNISSGAAKHPIDGWAAYCASKAGLDMLSQCASEEAKIRKNNTRIFSLSPGVVDTDMQAEIRQTEPERFSSIQRFKDYHRNKELQEPEQVAKKIMQVLENEEEYGEVLVNLPR